MKRKGRLFGILFGLAVLVTAVFAVKENTVADITGEVNAKTFYYDSVPKRVQELYLVLKEYYDSNELTSELTSVDLSMYLPKNFTEEDYNSFLLDLYAADLSLMADDPTYHWLGEVNSVYWDKDKGVCKAQLLRREELLDAYDEQAKARIQQIVKTVGEGDRYTKLRKLADYLMTEVWYDKYLFIINDSGSPFFSNIGFEFNHSMYGVLIDNIGVCDSFSLAMKVLCDELDIPCIIIGNAGHAWNRVQMEDGKWYHLDMTNFCRTGWDGELPQTKEAYFENDFLRMTFGMYGNPYMIAVNNVRYVTEFPELTEEQYQYTGSTTDFSYMVAASTYKPGNPEFLYSVNSWDSTTCTITHYMGKESGDLKIPETIDGYKVTHIGANAFYNCTGFTGKLIIPDTVTHIGKGAFAGCHYLSAVKMSQAIETIDIGAFVGCKGLTEVVLPDLLTEIGDYCFFDCNALKSVEFGTHIKSIGTEAFSDIETNLVIKGPAGSVAESAAASVGAVFEAKGTLCSMQDVDGKWECDAKGHYHTCKHGAKYDYAEHTVADGFANTCGEECEVCGMSYCSQRGFLPGEIITLQNVQPANCAWGQYSGDWVCVCGIYLEYGEYMGEPLGHTSEGSQWVCKENGHYLYCSRCEAEMEFGEHEGGKATATEQAVCTVCGGHYGELASGGKPGGNNGTGDTETGGGESENGGTGTAPGGDTPGGNNGTDDTETGGGESENGGTGTAPGGDTPGGNTETNNSETNNSETNNSETNNSETNTGIPGTHGGSVDIPKELRISRGLILLILIGAGVGVCFFIIKKKK